MKSLGQDEEAKISINILEKSFQIKCPSDKINELRFAADHLNEEMRKMRQAGIVGMDRLAVIAALNIAYDLLSTKKQRDDHIRMASQRIKELQTRVDDALTKAEQLEFNDLASLG